MNNKTWARYKGNEHKASPPHKKTIEKEWKERERERESEHPPSPIWPFKY